MLSAMLTVAGKVLALFLMIGVGVVCSRFKIVTARGASQITNILLYVVTPCLIISAFQVDMDEVSLWEIGISALLTIFSQMISLGIGTLLFRHQEDRRRKILRFAVIYSNCGFMGLPLVEAVLGSSGVIYASVYIAIFNVILWTHGYIMMSGEHENIGKKLLLNPGVIGFAIGLILLALRFRLPETVESVMESFSALNTPLSMLVIGTYVAKIRVKEFFSDKDIYLVSLFRLLLVPALFLALAYFLPVSKEILVSCVLLAAAPSAGLTVLFSAMFGGDAKLGSKLVAVTTLLSVLTMPVFAVVAQGM